MGMLLLAGVLGQSVQTVQDAIVTEARARAVDPRLALAVAQAESNFDQSRTSSAGAIGIFQLMPATAAWLGVNPYDWQDNIRGGVAYLSWLGSLYAGDLTRILAGYNWGPGNLADAQAAYGSAWLNYAPAETQNYIAAVSAAAGSVGSSQPPQVLTAGAGGFGGIDPQLLPWLLLGGAFLLSVT